MYTLTKSFSLQQKFAQANDIKMYVGLDQSNGGEIQSWAPALFSRFRAFALASAKLNKIDWLIEFFIPFSVKVTHFCIFITSHNIYELV